MKRRLNTVFRFYFRSTHRPNFIRIGFVWRFKEFVFLHENCNWCLTISSHHDAPQGFPRCFASCHTRVLRQENVTFCSMVTVQTTYCASIFFSTKLSFIRGMLVWFASAGSPATWLRWERNAMAGSEALMKLPVYLLSKRCSCIIAETNTT